MDHRAGAEFFVGDSYEQFFRQSIVVLPDHPAMHHAHDVPDWVVALPIGVAVAGIGLAVLMYIVAPGLPAAIAEQFRRVYLFLYNKWYFDELYDAVFVRPAFVLGRGFWKSGDGDVIDGVGPDGIASATLGVARRAVRLQSGYVYHYAFAMLIGVFLVITAILIAAMG